MMDKELEYGEHFVPVRTERPFPVDDEVACALLEKHDEVYLSKRYRTLRESGKMLEEAWTEVRKMLELDESDIEHIMMAVVGLVESSTDRIPQSWATTYEKIRSFHYDAFPKASTYILTKIVDEDQ